MARICRLAGPPQLSGDASAADLLLLALCCAWKMLLPLLGSCWPCCQLCIASQQQCRLAADCYLCVPCALTRGDTFLIGKKISSIGKEKGKKHLHREGNSRVTNTHEGLMDYLR